MQLEREKALEHKNRMSRMLEDRDLFVMRLKAARQSVYEVRFLLICELLGCFWRGQGPPLTHWQTLKTIIQYISRKSQEIFKSSQEIFQR